MASPAPEDPTIIGFSFVIQFYNILHEKPEDLFRFYKKESRLVFENQEVKGSDNIEAFFKKQNLLGTGIKVTALQAQDGVETSYVENGETKLRRGILVAVQGLFTAVGGKDRAFSQTFFLAAQPKGYYVFNDIFVFHDNYPSLPSAITFHVRQVKEPVPSLTPVPTPSPAPAVTSAASSTPAPTPVPESAPAPVVEAPPQPVSPPAPVQPAVTAPAPAPTQAPAPAKPVLEKVDKPVETTHRRGKHERHERKEKPQAAAPATTTTTAAAPVAAQEEKAQEKPVVAAPSTALTPAQPPKEKAAAPAPAPVAENVPKTWASITGGKTYVPVAKSVAEQQIEEEKAKQEQERQQQQKQQQRGGRSTTPRGPREPRTPREPREPREQRETRGPRTERPIPPGIVVNIPDTVGAVTDETLRGLFSKFGNITRIDNRTPEKRFVIIEYPTAEIASAAVSEAATTHITLSGVNLHVKLRNTDPTKTGRPHPRHAETSPNGNGPSGDRRGPRRNDRSPRDRPAGPRTERPHNERRQRPVTAPSATGTTQQ